MRVRIHPAASLIGVCALASAAAAAIDLKLVKSPAGTVLQWGGESAPYDAIRTDLGALVEQATTIDLGDATRIECGSPDASTAGGNEDATDPPVGTAFLYHVRGSSYGSSGGKELTPGAGTDCPIGGGSAGGHTADEVCARWKADYPEQSANPWTGSTGNCDEGVVDPVAIEDGVRRTNLYRWLVGLPPIAENPLFSSKDQAAVVIERALGMLTHTPQPGDPCYTADGAEGAGSSNLAAGYPTLAAAVDGYIGDSGVTSLGHRRWILYPPYAEGGFGLVKGGVYGTWSGQWVFGFGADPAPELVAYPAPGAFPIDALRGHWSLSVKGASFSAATVQVVRARDGAPMTVSGKYVPTGGYGLDTLAWDVAGIASDEDYVITVGGVAGTAKPSYVYTTRLVECP